MVFVGWDLEGRGVEHLWFDGEEFRDFEEVHLVVSAQSSEIVEDTVVPRHHWAREEVVCQSRGTL